MKSVESTSVKKLLPLASTGDVVLVDCKIDTSCDPACNVFLLNAHGETVWQIEKGVMSHGAIGYSDIYLGPNRELMAYSSNGVEYEIDQASGRILSKELIR